MLNEKIVKCFLVFPIIYIGFFHRVDCFGGSMKKGFVASLVFLTAGISFAGDAAAFKDIGFSSDGKTYIFGQYGKTDVKFQPYAEIYTIDVAKNEYVPGGVFKNLDDKSDRSGSQVYEDLYARHYLDIKNYGCKNAVADDILYILEDGVKKGTDEIMFKNYGGTSTDEQVSYAVRLVPTYRGSGANCLSSFYIDLSIGTDGASKKYKVGSPDIKRKGVVNYKIVRIFRSSDKSSLVFVVEKTVEDSSGLSIRYMVETVKL